QSLREGLPVDVHRARERDERDRQEDRQGRLVLDRFRQVQFLPALRGGLPDEAEVGLAFARLRAALRQARRDGAALEEGRRLRRQILRPQDERVQEPRDADPDPDDGGAKIMNVSGFVFYSLTAITILSALLVVSLRNVLHSALFLGLSLLGVA